MPIRRVETNKISSLDGTTAITIEDSTGKVIIGSGSNSFELPTTRPSSGGYALNSNSSGNSSWVEMNMTDKADKNDLNTTNEKVTSLAFRQAVDHSDVKYDLTSMVVDEFVDSSGIDTSASTNEVIAGGKCVGQASSTTTYNINGTSDSQDGSVQSLTLGSTVSQLTIEAWGGRGGASWNSWKKNESGTIDNTGSTPGSGEAGGFTVRLKGTYTGFNGGETIKIAVGKGANINTFTPQTPGDDNTADHGCHTGGGGASWVLLDHGSSSTIGQTRGVANNKRYTPLLVAGGGGGAAARSGYTYSQTDTPWTKHGATDANLATANGATRTSTTSLSSSGKYTTGTDDGEGGTGASISDGSAYLGGGGAGFLEDGETNGTTHSSYGGTNSVGKHPFHASTPFQGGGSGTSYGTADGGYGGGGGGSLPSAGGGGGFSGGSVTGLWSNKGANGIGGGSLFGSTVSIGGAYTNAISVTENTNTLADGTDVSPVTNGRDGRVIITQVSDANVTLQSTATTASSAPTKATLMVGYKNSAGTATINTDIKGYVSRDGTNFTEVTLVDKGTIGDYNLLTVHDATITTASGTSMKWKVTTHNQTSTKLTEVHAVSLGWK